MASHRREDLDRALEIIDRVTAADFADLRSSDSPPRPPAAPE
jgi:hypothetical protein